MDYEPLDIEDSDKRSEGGPPGWVAWAVIVVSVVIIVLTVFILGVLM